jgi:hypothetical protein
VSRQDEASQQRRRYSIDLSHENFDVSTIFSHRILTVISLTETQEVQRAGAKNLSHYLEKILAGINFKSVNLAHRAWQRYTSVGDCENRSS